MSERRKLIVVSNRGPLFFGRDASGERTVRRGGGGLVTALRGLIAHHDVTWIASAMSDEDRLVAGERGHEPIEEDRNGTKYWLRLVSHDQLAYDRYYNAVSNGTFWFIQHYLWGLASVPDIEPSFRTAWTQGYQRVNRAFADTVLEELERNPEAEVFIHDYHLYLAPGFVRESRPDARLAQFIHIPWAQADYWHVLPEDVRRAVHEGLLANDVVGIPHRPLAPQLHRGVHDDHRAPSGTRTATVSSTTAAAPTSTRARSGSTRRSSTRSSCIRRSSRRSGASSRSARSC